MKNGDGETKTVAKAVGSKWQVATERKRCLPTETTRMLSDGHLGILHFTFQVPRLPHRNPHQSSTRAWDRGWHRRSRRHRSHCRHLKVCRLQYLLLRPGATVRPPWRCQIQFLNESPVSAKRPLQNQSRRQRKKKTIFLQAWVSRPSPHLLQEAALVPHIGRLQLYLVHQHHPEVADGDKHPTQQLLEECWLGLRPLLHLVWGLAEAWMMATTTGTTTLWTTYLMTNGCREFCPVPFQPTT